MGEIIASLDSYFSSLAHNFDWTQAGVSRLIPQRGIPTKKNCTIPLGDRAVLICNIPCRVNSVPERLRDQSYANRPCLRNRHALGYQV